ncbi:hypothetical protein ACXWTF_04030 [Thiomicrolovo sp. ZZH C-3]
MLRTILGTVILLAALQAAAAPSVTLKVQQQEQRLYKTETKTVTSNLFDIKGSKETMAQIAAAGVTLPMEVNQTQAMVKTLKTGRAAKGGKLPFSGSLDNAASVVSSRGNQATQKHFEVTGSFDGAKPVIETVKGEGITPELEGRVKQALANAMASPVYPEKPIKVGEHFTQQVPVTLPMQGAAPIQMVLTTTYTLKKIDGAKAHFDIAQHYALAPGADQKTLTLGGEGHGAMTYDSTLSQVTALKTEGMMDLSVTNGDKVSMIKTTTVSTVTTTVTPVK